MVDVESFAGQLFLGGPADFAPPVGAFAKFIEVLAGHVVLAV
jgi:hypothetical protein